MSEFERAEDEQAFMRALVAGLADLEAGRDVSLPQARKRHGNRHSTSSANRFSA